MRVVDKPSKNKVDPSAYMKDPLMTPTKPVDQKQKLI